MKEQDETHKTKQREIGKPSERIQSNDNKKMVQNLKKTEWTKCKEEIKINKESNTQ